MADGEGRGGRERRGERTLSGVFGSTRILEVEVLPEKQPGSIILLLIGRPAQHQIVTFARIPLINSSSLLF